MFLWMGILSVNSVCLVILGASWSYGCCVLVFPWHSMLEPSWWMVRAEISINWGNLRPCCAEGALRRQMKQQWAQPTVLSFSILSILWQDKTKAFLCAAWAAQRISVQGACWQDDWTWSGWKLECPRELPRWAGCQVSWRRGLHGPCGSGAVCSGDAFVGQLEPR